MINKLLSSNTKRMLVKIGKAIEKGACVDIQDYLNDNNTTTRNAVCFVRIDKINTNLSHIIDPETARIKVFKRSSWEGVVVIDDESKSIFSIFTEKTIRRVPKNKTRKKPHYSQTFLNTLNKEEIAPIKQTTLVGFESLPEAKFSVDEYECICRRKNRSCTDFEPHLAGKITAVFHMDFWEFYVEKHVENRYNYF